MDSTQNEEKYKYSNYNFWVDRDKEIILYNSYHGVMILLPDTISTKVKEIKEDLSRLKKDFPKLYELFLQKEIIIESDKDEREGLEERKQGIIKNRRLFLVILTTEQCNFRCRYCYEDHKKGKMSKELQDGLVSFVEQNISKYDSLQVQWLGGEPLLAKDVVYYLSEKFLEICNRNHKVYFASMITNGYLLTSEVVNQLYKYRVISYQITIDGIKEVHDAQRCLAGGMGTFDVIMSNLLKVKEAIKNKRVSILLQTNISKLGFDKMKEFQDFMMKNFGNDRHFEMEWSFVEDMGGVDIQQFRPNLLGTIEDEKKLSRMKLEASKEGVMFSEDRYLLVTGAYICYSCYENSYIFGSDGTIYKCCDEMYSKESKIGQLTKQGELVIDEEKQAAFCQKAEVNNKCQTCKLYPLCMGLKCPIHNIRNHGTSLCIQEKMMIEENIIRLSYHNPNCIIFEE